MPVASNNENPLELISTEDIYKNKNVLALVIDNEVVELFMCEERLSAILQSNPTIIDVTDRDPFFKGPLPGWKYDGKEFSLD